MRGASPDPPNKEDFDEKNEAEAGAVPGRVAVVGLREPYGVGRGRMDCEDCCCCCEDGGGKNDCCCCEDEEREAETTAERGGSDRVAELVRLPVGGRLVLDPGRISPRVGSGRPKLNVGEKERKEWEGAAAAEARKDWPGSRKEWLLLDLESASESACGICQVGPW